MAAASAFWPAADPSARGGRWRAQNDRTPLSHAAQYGHAEVARALLAAGAHPSVRADSEKGGLAAIHYAAARGAVAVVRLLLQQPGADANARDEVRPARARSPG